MATNFQIDNALLDQAKEIAGFSTKSETVNEALREFIQSRLRKQLLEMRGQVEYFDDYDYKALRPCKRRMRHFRLNHFPSIGWLPSSLG